MSSTLDRISCWWHRYPGSLFVLQWAVRALPDLRRWLHAAVVFCSTCREELQL